MDTIGENRKVGCGCSGCRERGVFSALPEAGEKEKKGSHRTRWAAPPTFIVSMPIFVWGKAQLSGHKLERGAGHCFLDCGGIAPLMKPLVC